MADIKIPRSLVDDAAHRIAIRWAGDRFSRLSAPEEIAALYAEAYDRAKHKLEAELEIDETK